MPRTEPAAAMRVDWHLAQRLLLRAGARKPGEPRVDATVGRAASGTSGVWEPALDGGVAPGGQSQTGGATAGVNGGGGHLSQAKPEPTGRRAPDLSLPLGRAANQRSGPGLDV